MRSQGWFRVLTDGSGRPFSAFEVFCEEPWPSGLGLPPGVGPAILAETDTSKRLAVLKLEIADARALPNASERGKKGGKAGGRGRKADYKSKRPIQGNSKEHILSELKTYAPAILERYRAGEFRSAASARREAVRQELLNPRRLPNRLNALRANWRKATDEERAAFIAEICRPERVAA
jgi:hypothetical protein